jgi:hypothetical protein
MRLPGGPARGGALCVDDGWRMSPAQHPVTPGESSEEDEQDAGDEHAHAHAHWQPLPLQRSADAEDLR